MKTFLFSALILCFITTNSISQTIWDSVEVDIPAEEFPISGFDLYGISQDTPSIAVMVNEIKEAGMNSDYQAKQASFYFRKSLASMKGGLKGYDFFEELTSNPNYLQGWADSHISSEQRFFLASNFPEKTADYNFECETRANWLKAAKNSNNPKITPEYYISRLDYIKSDPDHSDSTEPGVILKDLMAFVQVRAYVASDSSAQGHIETIEPVTREIRETIDGKKEVFPMEYALTPHSNLAYCDFIYRIPPPEPGDTIPSGNLFKIEYSMTFDDEGTVNKTVKLDSSFITTDSSGQLIGDVPAANEHKNIVTFPNVNYFRGFSSDVGTYKVHRSVFQVNNLPENKLKLIGAKENIKSIRLECKVTRLQPVDIIVRGLRIRSEVAEDILADKNGKIDQIKDIIEAKIRSYDKTSSGTYDSNTEWDNLLGWAGGNEFYNCDIRVWSVVCSLAMKARVLMTVDGHNIVRKGKPIHCFMAQNLPDHQRFGDYRAIFEDQTDSVPPPFVMEGLEMGKPSVSHQFIDSSKVLFGRSVCEASYLPIASDAIPAELRHYSDFNELRNREKHFWFDEDVNDSTNKLVIRSNGILLGLTGDLKSKIFPTGQACSTSGVFDYDSYTTAFQYRMENPAVPVKEAAFAAYPPYTEDVKRFGKWFMNIPTMWSLVANGNLKGGTTTEQQDGTSLPAITDTAKALRNAITHDLIANSAGSTPLCVPNAHKVNLMDILPPDTPSTYLGSDYDFHVDYRPLTATEMRAHAWYGICWGAKGIQYNTLGTDRGHNIGMVGRGFERDKDYDINPNMSLPSDRTDLAFKYINRFRLGRCMKPILSLPGEDGVVSTETFDHNVVRNTYVIPELGGEWTHPAMFPGIDTMKVIGSSTATEVEMKEDGSIVGLSLTNNTLFSAGSCTAKVFINGIDTNFQTIINDDNQMANKAKKFPHTVSFKKGDKVKIQLFADVSMAPSELTAKIMVSYNTMGTWKQSSIPSNTDTTMSIEGQVPLFKTVPYAIAVDSFTLSGTNVPSNATCSVDVFINDNSVTWNHPILVSLDSGGSSAKTKSFPLRFHKNDHVSVKVRPNWAVSSSDNISLTFSLIDRTFDIVVPVADLVGMNPNTGTLRDLVVTKYEEWVKDPLSSTNPKSIYGATNYASYGANVAPDNDLTVSDRFNYANIDWTDTTWDIVTDECMFHDGEHIRVFTRPDIIETCSKDPNINLDPNFKSWWSSWHFSGLLSQNLTSISDPYINIYTPWYYGCKERWFAARKIMQDIKPAAKTISELIWQRTTIGANKLNTQSVTSTEGNKLPILWYEKSSQKITGDAPLSEPAVYSYVKNRPNRYFFKDNPSGSDLESQQEALYEFGLFKYPKDDDALYVAMMNRRTWPVRFKDKDNINDWPDSKILSDTSISDLLVNDTTDILRVDKWFDGTAWQTDTLKGAIDVRKFSFRVNRKAFTSGDSINHFVVTNLRTGRERLITFNSASGEDSTFIDTFCVVLEPGEGTLLKISPAYSLAAGMTSEAGMAYNNGHRIAEIGSSTPTPRKKIIVWEKNGNIEYRITNSPGPQTPMENTFDPNGAVLSVVKSTLSLKNYNPSVAASGNNIVVVYSRETADKSDRKVFARWGVFNPGPSTITWKTAFVLDTMVFEDEETEPDQLITPVVTPGANGFLCAWSNSDDVNNNIAGHGIQLKYIILDGSGNVIPDTTQPAPPTIQNEPNIISEIFPTLASRNEVTESSTHESFHLAWEGVFSTGESQIYYTRYDHDQNDNWTSLTTERVTKFVDGCKHHHPNIAVKDEYELIGDVESKVHGEPIVTWEREEEPKGIRGETGGDDRVFPSVANPEGFARSVMVRHRLSLGQNKWSGIISIRSTFNPLPLPMIKAGGHLCQSWPCFIMPSPNNCSEWLTFMNSKNSQVNVTTFTAPTPFNRIVVNHRRLPESGLYPNLSLNFDATIDQFLLNTLTFRGTEQFNVDTSKFYRARVTAPLVENILESVPEKVAVKTVNGTTDNCGRKFSFAVGNPDLRPAIWCTGCSDTIYFHIGSGIPIPWNKYDIIDTRPGYYSESDTTIYNWPRTEDSVRTEDFEYSLDDTLSFDRIFLLEDTAWVKTLINDSTLSHINFSVLLKDSASGSTIATLDQIQIDTASIDVAVKRFGVDNITSVSSFLAPMPSPTSLYMPQGPGRKVQWIANTAAPSGKAYITIHASKEYNMPIVMSLEHGEYDNFDVILPAFDTALFKQAGQQPISPSAAPSVSTTPVTLTINPNPFEGSTRVTVETVKDVPLAVQVYNLLGGLVGNLFNQMSTQTHYEFTLDSRVIRPGTYFIRVQAGNGIVTKKVQFVK